MSRTDRKNKRALNKWGGKHQLFTELTHWASWIQWLDFGEFAGKDRMYTTVAFALRQWISTDKQD